MTELEQIGFDFLYPKEGPLRGVRSLTHVGFLVRFVKSCVSQYSGHWQEIDDVGLVWLNDMRGVLGLTKIDFTEKKEEKQ